MTGRQHVSRSTDHPAQGGWAARHACAPPAVRPAFGQKGALGITIGGGWLGAIINLIIAALVLMFSDRFVKGMKVNGFVGAIVAAIAIGVVTWLINWLLGLLGLA